MLPSEGSVRFATLLPNWSAVVPTLSFALLAASLSVGSPSTALSTAELGRKSDVASDGAMKLSGTLLPTPSTSSDPNSSSELSPPADAKLGSANPTPVAKISATGIVRSIHRQRPFVERNIASP